MRSFSDTELDNYLSTGSSMDKAGGYGIQDQSFQPVMVDQIEGCFTNVMGLPLCHLQQAAESIGYPFKRRIPKSCSPEMGYDCALLKEVFSS
jgi:predicted house-cleaning NTP pyrophosphatase (Maf/HAM1 superfamily)